MLLSDFINVTNVIISAQDDSKFDIINKLIDVAEKNGCISDKDQCINDVLEREAEQSTGLEKGIAVPHAKSEGVEDFAVALYVNKNGVDFDSGDGKPTHLVFLLLAQLNQTGKHLKILGTIAHLVDDPDFMQQLIDAATPEEVMEKIRKEEDF